MAVDDSKKSRLSSLSQDVIAVPKRVEPQSRAREESPAPKAPVQPQQQAPYVAPPSQPAQPARRVPAAEPVSQAPSPLLWIFATVSVIALLVALSGRFDGQAAGQEGAASTQAIERLTAELTASNQRVAALEERLAAADADAQGSGPQAQASVLQLGVAVRGMRNDLDRYTNELDKVTVQVAELRKAVAASGKDAGVKPEQLAALSARVSSLADQVTAVSRAPKTPAGSTEADAQLRLLSQKTDKMANDIRQLYRLLEGR